jgi:hypothetical protein
MNATDDQTSASEAANEVELSAQDLLGLAPVAAKPVAAAATVAAPAVAATPPAPAASAKPKAKTPPSSPMREMPRIAAQPLLPNKRSSSSAYLTIAVGVVLAIAVSVVFQQFSDKSAPVRLAHSTIPAKPDPQPVLVKNPFDEAEVFELPPGTTEAQANAYLSEVLLQRASERKASN